MSSFELADVPFGDELAWLDFLQRNSLEHKRFSRLITSATGKQVGVEVFSSEGNLQNWLQANSDAHQAEMKILGITNSINLVDVDLSDQQAYNDWMANHAMIHQITRRALGL